MNIEQVDRDSGDLENVLDLIQPSRLLDGSEEPLLGFQEWRARHARPHQLLEAGFDASNLRVIDRNEIALAERFESDALQIRSDKHRMSKISDPTDIKIDC